MNLRIAKNEIRIRLSKNEAKMLLDNNCYSEQYKISENTSILLELHLVEETKFSWQTNDKHWICKILRRDFETLLLESAHSKNANISVKDFPVSIEIDTWDEKIREKREKGSL